MPVPKDKDTGAKYKNSIVSSGPYKFEDLQPGKSFNLVRNDQWDPATDPNRKALPDRIEVALNVNADDIDNRVLSGDLDIDIAGTGVQPAAQSRVLQDPNIKANADNPLGARLWYTSINPTVAPLDNIDCRKAVMYAMDQTAYQTAYGGQFAGGDLATTVLPPLIPGYQAFDLYPNGQDHKGDLDAAKKSLEACGQPNWLRDQHRLPRRAAQGEGHSGGVPAGAVPGRHQAHAEAVPGGRILRQLRRATRRTW